MMQLQSAPDQAQVLTDLQAKVARLERIVRIADFSIGVTVVDHVMARPPQVWGFMEVIFEVWGCSAGGVK
jgi:hypothetical protein